MAARVIDYLAEELKREAKQQEKRSRVAKMLTSIKAVQQKRVVDFLA